MGQIKNNGATENVAANRNYKSTVFAMLFGERERLLRLYNAISGKNYQDPEALEINTLENAIYMGMKNDLSFLIDDRLSLYEHQSTVNPNMPLRFCFTFPMCIPASNEPSGHACMTIWRLPQGSKTSA